MRMKVAVVVVAAALGWGPFVDVGTAGAASGAAAAVATGEMSVGFGPDVNNPVRFELTNVRAAGLLKIGRSLLPTTVFIARIDGSGSAPSQFGPMAVVPFDLSGTAASAGGFVASCTASGNADPDVVTVTASCAGTLKRATVHFPLRLTAVSLYPVPLLFVGSVRQ